MDHVSLYSTRRKPERQPKAVAAGFEGKCNPGDRAAGPDRLIPPAMQQGKQPFWARLQLLARLTLNPGKDAGTCGGIFGGSAVSDCGAVEVVIGSAG